MLILEKLEYVVDLDEKREQFHMDTLVESTKNVVHASKNTCSCVYRPSIPLEERPETIYSKSQNGLSIRLFTF